LEIKGKSTIDLEAMILYFHISISLNTVTKANCKPISQRQRPRVGHTN